MPSSTEIPFGTWPDIHPQDPGGFDDWEPGVCEICEGDSLRLVRHVPCNDPECTGCLAVCLTHEKRGRP